MHKYHFPTLFEKLETKSTRYFRPIFVRFPIPGAESTREPGPNCSTRGVASISMTEERRKQNRLDFWNRFFFFVSNTRPTTKSLRKLRSKISTRDFASVSITENGPNENQRRAGSGRKSGAPSSLNFCIFWKKSFGWKTVALPAILWPT